MKGLLARFATATLGATLILLVVQGAQTTVTASGGSRSPSASLVAQARANFIKVMSSHAINVGKDWVSPGAKHGVAPSARRGAAAKTANGTVTLTASANWSGYADAEASTTTVSNVNGSWIMPSVRCLPRPYQNSDAFLADWVGIDGYNNGTVEQLGSATQCFEGVEYYYVWYEMYPQGMVEEGTTACINDNVNCPQPGDRMSASVTVTPAGSGENNYTLTLTDHTRPQESFSTTQQCAAATCVDSSAEWIIERPAVAPPFGVQILPLADFSQSFFIRAGLVSGGQATSIQGFSGGSVNDITMNDDTASYDLDCVDQPSPPASQLLTSDATACPVATPFRGGGFETTWDASF
jgi:peptidase A4-like protein